MDVVGGDVLNGLERRSMSPWATVVATVVTVEAAAGATEVAHRRGWISWRVPYMTDLIRARSRLVQLGAWGAIATVIFDHLVTRRVFR